MGGLSHHLRTCLEATGGRGGCTTTTASRNIDASCFFDKTENCHVRGLYHGTMPHVKVIIGSFRVKKKLKKIDPP